MSAEAMQSSARNLIQELVSSKDQAEALLSLADAAKKGADMGAFLQHCVVESLNSLKGVPMADRLTPIKELIPVAVANADTPLTADDGNAAVVLLLRDVLPELVDEVLAAPKLLGALAGELLGKGVLTLTLKSIGEALLEAGEKDEEAEDPPLVDGDNAAPVLIKLLAALKEAAGEAKAAELWSASGLQMATFFPSFADERTDAKKLKEALEKDGVAFAA